MGLIHEKLAKLDADMARAQEAAAQTAQADEVEKNRAALFEFLPGYLHDTRGEVRHALQGLRAEVAGLYGIEVEAQIPLRDAEAKLRDGVASLRDAVISLQDAATTADQHRLSVFEASQLSLRAAEAAQLAATRRIERMLRIIVVQLMGLGIWASAVLYLYYLSLLPTQ
jgi:hypothetical protein